MNRVAAAETPSGLAEQRQSALPFAPFATVWGIQAMVCAILQYIWMWPHQERLAPICAGLAVLASLCLWLKAERGRARPSSPGRWTASRPLPATAIAPSLAIIAVATTVLWLLLQLLDADPNYTAAFRALLLSVGYAFAGKWLGRPFFLLSICLLAFTLIVTVFYLGFTTVVLGFFSGLSLIVCASLIKIAAPKDNTTIAPPGK